jgi:hypothetical protein
VVPKNPHANGFQDGGLQGCMLASTRRLYSYRLQSTLINIAL